MNGIIVAISTSKKKGVPKSNLENARLIEDKGIDGDIHAEGGVRQISLLASESIEKMRSKGLKVRPGSFAENITTADIDLLNLNINDRIRLGGSTILEISQKGKVCHKPCAIYYRAGDCVMPKEGVFGRVVKGGVIKVGDSIEVINV
ncbi:MAG: MOSC domain-containing protein [Candidatus Omnitrophica bacterium CG1_02_49_10]|nr:MAG: MOSC domain-containing protein [Candidatus Omnitrophica bacterium CG1_02_49_10]